MIPFFFGPCRYGRCPDHYNRYDGRYGDRYSCGRYGCGNRYYDRYDKYDRYDRYDNRYFRYASAEMTDNGPEPYVMNISEETEQNNMYRKVVWTGDRLQLTLMSIPAGGDIGIEMHPDTDQFLRVEQGQGIAMMGMDKNNLDYQRNISPGYAILIPAGTWHNIVNTGRQALKLYSIYAPPHHPRGTIQRTKNEAQAEDGSR